MIAFCRGVIFVRCIFEDFFISWFLLMGDVYSKWLEEGKEKLGKDFDGYGFFFVVLDFVREVYIIFVFNG